MTGAAVMGLVLATVGGGAAASPVATVAELDALRWRSRVLVVLAADAADPALSRQRQVLAAMGDDAGRRDLVVREVVGVSTDADALRRRLGVLPGGFRAVLVGKDGGAKLRSDRPIAAVTLADTIDAMPMRQDEMRRDMGRHDRRARP